MNQEQGRAAILAWQQTVDAAYQRQQQALATNESPGFLESAGDVVEAGVNGIASIGNAVLNNPEAVLELAGGAALAVFGAGVATGGVALDLTGAGAVVGVPANAAGAGMMVAGGGLVFDGMRRLADAANGPDRVEPLQVDWKWKNDPAEETEDIRRHQRESNDAYNRSWEKANPDGTRKIPKDDEIPPLFRKWGR